MHALQLFLAEVKTGRSWSVGSALWADAQAHWITSLQKGYITFPPSSQHYDEHGRLDLIGPAKLTFQGMRVLAQG